ncbi:DMT family transporter [Olsenella sp. HMSC062G07]|uniref:DMT family transporter n=1 Tax=Olsenella sp. HMSC062G07 TaxID=1739330 RepID=UPI0008A1EAE4|nr:DMT family transporter [Olsenella sp. HMSC062G07]
MSKEFTKYLASLVLFGSNGIVAAHVALPVCQLVLWRTLAGSILILAALAGSCARTSSRARADASGVGAPRLAATDHPREALSLAASGAALGVGWIFLFGAYRLVGVGVATLTYYCGPVIVMALSPLLCGERLTCVKVACLSSVAVGAALVVLRGAGPAPDVAGLALGAGSAVMYAAMVLFAKRAPHVGGMESAAIQLVASCVAVTTWAALTGTLPTPSSLVGPSLPALLVLSVVNTGVGCYLYFSSLGALSVQRVAVCGYLEPLSAVLLSALLLGETLTPLCLLGGLLIIGGAVSSELAGSVRLRRRTCGTLAHGRPVPANGLVAGHATH